MSDFLAIENLELWTHIGVPDEERAIEQQVLVTIVMYVDASNAGWSDKVSDTIDYEAVVNDVKQLAKTERKTVEKLAHDIALLVLDQHGAKQVTVSIAKFVISGTSAVRLSITRP